MSTPVSHRAGTPDRHIGYRIHRRRVLVGVTQAQLAAAIGVTYQQLHNYERGFNRITVGRLHAVANVLGVTVPWFFEGLERDQPELQEDQQRLEAFVADVARIRNPVRQRALCDLTRALAA